MKDSNACRRTRLVQTGPIAIDECSCGQWHVHVGPVTLRVMPEVAGELAAALESARRTRRGEAMSRDEMAMQAATLLRGL